MTQPMNATWSAKQGKFRKPSAIVANFPKKETEGVYKHRGQITTNSIASVSRAHSARISLSIHRSIFNVLVKNKPTTVPMVYSILLKTGSLGDAIQELLLAYYIIPNALSRTNCLIASKNIQKQMWPSCQLRIWHGFKVIVLILTSAKSAGLLHVICFKPVCRFSARRISVYSTPPYA